MRRMPHSRASANQLAKLLGDVTQPLYVVAADGRIVFVNDACAAWAGVDAKDLADQACQYSAATEVIGPAAVAAALCPPPEVFSGRRLKALIVLPGQPDDFRHAEFIPLVRGGNAGSAVLAIVGKGPSEEAASSADEASGPQLHARLQQFRRRLSVRVHVDRLVGDSPAMRRVRTQVKLAATSAVSVLVLAPRGSGGEHVGRAIHYGDGNAAGPLVPLACPLLDIELLQATLRSLARAKSSGQRAATLLLTEVESLSEAVQIELARSLAAGALSARIISISASPLTEVAARGVFRADLACWLSTLIIQMPPLAQRMADLPLLVQWYIEQANLRSEKQVGGCSPEALDRLANHAWTGDLAELEGVIVEAHERAKGPLVAPQDLPERLILASQASARPARAEETIVLEEYLASIEHELIVRALRRAKGNKTKAARLLGMTRPRLYRRLVQLGLAEV